MNPSLAGTLIVDGLFCFVNGALTTLTTYSAVSHNFNTSLVAGGIVFCTTALTLFGRNFVTTSDKSGGTTNAR